MGWLNDAIRAQTNDIGATIANTPNRQKIIDLRDGVQRRTRRRPW